MRAKARWQGAADVILRVVETDPCAGVPGDRDDADELDGLVFAARRAEEWALAALYRALHPALVGFLTGLVPEEAEDLAAETWIDAASCLPDLEGGGAGFRRLLFTIARRRALDHTRKRWRRRTDVAEVGDRADAGLTSDPEELVESLDETRQAIERICALLPRSQAEVVILRVVGGLSVTEVAEIIGRSPAAVSILQSRGLRKLAAKIGDRSGWERG